MRWVDERIEVDLNAISEQDRREMELEEMVHELEHEMMLRNWNIRRVFPWQAAEHRQLTWLHRIKPNQRCALRFPYFHTALPIAGAISIGYETLVLTTTGTAVRILGPMPVEIFPLPKQPMETNHETRI